MEVVCIFLVALAFVASLAAVCVFAIEKLGFCGYLFLFANFFYLLFSWMFSCVYFECSGSDCLQALAAGSTDGIHALYAVCLCGLFLLFADATRVCFISSPYDVMLLVVRPVAAICLGIGISAVFAVGFGDVPGPVICLGEYFSAVAGILIGIVCCSKRLGHDESEGIQ